MFLAIRETDIQSFVRRKPMWRKKQRRMKPGSRQEFRRQGSWR
jgi:hypothetical protein